MVTIVSVFITMVTRSIPLTILTCLMTGVVLVVSGKLAGVELSKLVYADARCLVSVTVYNADGTVYGTATDSIESCAFRGNDDLFVNLMKFADSARAELSA